MNREEQLARMVRGIAAFGGTIEQVIVSSHGSASIIQQAMKYVDPEDQNSPTPWTEVLVVLTKALRRVGLIAEHVRGVCCRFG